MDAEAHAHTHGVSRGRRSGHAGKSEARGGCETYGMKIERKHGAKRREKVKKKALCEGRKRAGTVIGKVEGQSEKRDSGRRRRVGLWKWG